MPLLNLAPDELPVEKARAPHLAIALINNMPDGALAATERQFRGVLAAAAGKIKVALTIFSLPEVPRGDVGLSYLRSHCRNLGLLWEGMFDGMIVTGTEPRTPRIQDEPYWLTFTKLVDWAERQTISTIWSCLAAHATVYYLDHIERNRFGRKLSGVFEFRKVHDHSILEGIPSRWRVPHSRRNGLPEHDLVARNYSILMRSPTAGPDIFIKERSSLFVFFQGHPEYDRGALLREYRRDVRRFLAGQSEAYPEIPKGYFSADVVGALREFHQKALRNKQIGYLQNFPSGAIKPKLQSPWREISVGIYANWLTLIAERKFGRNGIFEPRFKGGRAVSCERPLDLTP